MTELLVIAVVVVLFLTNGGWDWIKSKLPNLQAAADKAKQDLEPVKQDGAKLVSDVHTLIDNWLALCKTPGIVDDPESRKAMETIKSKILDAALPPVVAPTPPAPPAA